MRHQGLSNVTLGERTHDPTGSKPTLGMFSLSEGYYIRAIESTTGIPATMSNGQNLRIRWY